MLLSNIKINPIKILITFSLIASPLVAKANLIWPSIYIVAHYYVWYIIIAGLLIEFFAVKWFTESSWKRSLVMTLVMNLMSAIIGVIIIPISGVIVEFILMPFGGGTFSLSHWIIDYVFAVACNTLIEGLSLKWFFKCSLKETFFWLLIANAISIIISLLSMLFL